MALVKNVRLLLQQCFKNHQLFKYSTACDSSSIHGIKTEWTSKLEFTGPDSYAPVPIYQVLNHKGQLVDASQDPKLSAVVLEKMYKDMTMLNTMDKFLYECQRQGRISLYMTSLGEEATHIGSAAALSNDDLAYGQYREQGVLMWRGFSISDFVNQCFGNCDDIGKGRQMPVHYGSKKLNFMTISSTLTTQLPQAVGAAYALKGKGRVVICYFGEGAASEGDAHAAFNFAATTDSPVLFFCRNNGYAISTPTSEQYKGDGIAGRGPSYGINSIRVDGNDIFAVYNATKKARQFALDENKPVIIEAITYRVGYHSTADHNWVYRTKEEINQWAAYSPISRLRLYLQNNNLWDDEKENQWLSDTKKRIIAAAETAEKKLHPKWTEMFYDVYEKMPDHLMKQMTEMQKHVELYKDKYPLSKYAESANA